MRANSAVREFRSWRPTGQFSLALQEVGVRLDELLSINILNSDTASHFDTVFGGRVGLGKRRVVGRVLKSRLRIRDFEVQSARLGRRIYRPDAHAFRQAPSGENISPFTSLP